MFITELRTGRARGDWEEVLALARALPLEELKRRADAACRRVHGDGVWLRGLIEISNVCPWDCWYCGLRASNGQVRRYRLEAEEIRATVRAGFEAGLRTFVLQGGEDPLWGAETMARLLGQLTEETRGEAAFTLSLGLQSRATYALWRRAGACRYLMRFETADPALFARYRPGTTLAERLRGLNDLAELDYEVGSGFLVGLPGETESTRQANWRLCWEQGFDMVGIGPFIPHPETPLGTAPQEPLSLAEESTAVVRLLLPEAHLPATTAAGSLHPRGREAVLAGGANVLMPNLTPVSVKKDYLLYPNKICVGESGLDCIGCLDLRVRTLGKRLRAGAGSAPRRQERAPAGGPG